MEFWDSIKGMEITTHNDGDIELNLDTRTMVYLNKNNVLELIETLNKHIEIIKSQ